MPDFVKAIPAPYTAIALAALIAASGAFGYVKGYLSQAEKFSEYKAQVEAINERTKIENDRAKKENERITHETAQGWAAAVDYLKSHPVGMRSNSRAGTMLGLSRPATGTNATAPIDANRPQCDAPTDAPNVNDCIHDAAQLLWLIDWVKQQTEVRHDFR